MINRISGNPSFSLFGLIRRCGVLGYTAKALAYHRRSLMYTPTGLNKAVGFEKRSASLIAVADLQCPGRVAKEPL